MAILIWQAYAIAHATTPLQLTILFDFKMENLLILGVVILSRYRS